MWSRRTSAVGLLALVLLCGAPAVVSAQVAYVAASQCNTFATNQTSPAGILTCAAGAGSNRVYVVFVMVGDTTQDAASAVACGGQSLTKIWDQSDSTWTRTQGWAMKETAVAAMAGGVCALTLSGTVEHFIVGAATFSGVDQTTTFGTAVTATGNSTTPSVTITSQVNDLVIASSANDDDNAFANNNTILFEVEGVGTDTGGGAQYAAGAASVTHTWTIDSHLWTAGGINLIQVGGGGGGAAAPRNLLLLGVGP